MGINFNKIPINEGPILSPIDIKNPNEARTVYLVIHKPKTEQKDKSREIEKTSHFAIAMDLSGIGK